MLEVVVNVCSGIVRRSRWRPQRQPVHRSMQQVPHHRPRVQIADSIVSSLVLRVSLLKKWRPPVPPRGVRCCASDRDARVHRHGNKPAVGIRKLEHVRFGLIFRVRSEETLQQCGVPCQACQTWTKRFTINIRHDIRSGEHIILYLAVSSFREIIENKSPLTQEQITEFSVKERGRAPCCFQLDGYVSNATLHFALKINYFGAILLRLTVCMPQLRLQRKKHCVLVQPQQINQNAFGLAMQKCTVGHLPLSSKHSCSLSHFALNGTNRNSRLIWGSFEFRKPQIEFCEDDVAAKRNVT